LVAIRLCGDRAPEPQVIARGDRDRCVVELALDHGDRSQLVELVEREERFEVGPRKPLGEGECVELGSACTAR